jgi:hypothetical protein
MISLGRHGIIAIWKGEDVGGAFFMAVGFIHAGDDWVTNQGDGDFGAVEAELFAHASEECFEWRPGDTDGSLAVQDHCWVNIANLDCKSRLKPRVRFPVCKSRREIPALA